MDMPRPHNIFMAATVAHQRPLVIGYARVSTGQQAKKRNSLLRQVEKIREHAKKRRHQLIMVVEDTGSASKLSLDERPKLVAVLKQLNQSCHVVTTHHGSEQASGLQG